jgi:hypothetical protein
MSISTSRTRLPHHHRASRTDSCTGATGGLGTAAVTRVVAAAADPKKLATVRSRYDIADAVLYDADDIWRRHRDGRVVGTVQVP